jgi:hypothetical protein
LCYEASNLGLTGTQEGNFFILDGKPDEQIAASFDISVEEKSLRAAVVPINVVVDAPDESAEVFKYIGLSRHRPAPHL